MFPLDYDLIRTTSGTFSWGEAGWNPRISDKTKHRLYQIEENFFVMQLKVLISYQPLNWLRLYERLVVNVSLSLQTSCI
jgi:hypothetical protein